MGAAVRVEASALTDPRMVLFGQLLGTSHYDALGRLIHLWAYCTERGESTITERIAGVVLGSSDAVGALVEADLAEVTDGGIYVRGTTGRIEWLAAKRSAAAKGAKARWGNGKRMPDASQPDATRIDVAGKLSCPPAPAPAPASSISVESTDPVATPPSQPKPRFNLEALYQRYPRKQGKQRGLKLARTRIRTEADYQALEQAVERMAVAWAHVPAAERTYCPHWATFISQERWRDDELPLPSAPRTGQPDTRVWIEE